MGWGTGSYSFENQLSISLTTSITQANSVTGLAKRESNPELHQHFWCTPEATLHSRGHSLAIGGSVDLSGCLDPFARVSEITVHPETQGQSGKCED